MILKQAGNTWGVLVLSSWFLNFRVLCGFSHTTHVKTWTTTDLSHYIHDLDFSISALEGSLAWSRAKVICWCLSHVFFLPNIKRSQCIILECSVPWDWVGRTETIVDLTSFVNQFTSSVSYQILVLFLVFLECSMIQPTVKSQQMFPSAQTKFIFVWWSLHFLEVSFLFFPSHDLSCSHNLQRNCKTHSHENLQSLKAKKKQIKKAKKRINPPMS